MTTPHHDATLDAFHDAQRVASDLARQLEGNQPGELPPATLARSLLSRLYQVESLLLETPMTDKQRGANRIVMLDARTLEEVIVEEDPDLEAEFIQFVQDHRGFLEFLRSDNDSWESVGRLLGYMVDEAKRDS